MKKLFDLIVVLVTLLGGGLVVQNFGGIVDATNWLTGMVNTLMSALS